MKVYYYRKLKSTGGYKCAGHGAEDSAHRTFYLPFFKSNQDNDPRFEADCILSEYKGDIINPPAPEPVEAAPDAKWNEETRIIREWQAVETQEKWDKETRIIKEWQAAEQHRLEHSGDGDCDRHPLG